MKNLLLTFIAIGFCGISFGQVTIEKSYVDEFTNRKIIQTSWINLKDRVTSSHIRFSKFDNTFVIDCKLNYNNQIIAIRKGAELLFKMDNGEIAKFKCVGYAIATYGGGAISSDEAHVLGLMARYTPTDSIALNLLLKNKISKIRIIATNGYIEQELDANGFNYFQKAYLILKEEYEKMVKTTAR
jgi:hypothetical protein